MSLRDEYETDPPPQKEEPPVPMGRAVAFYIWPAGHEEGTPFPDDFIARLFAALHAAGFDAESV